jgi:hypothetical protein
MLKIVLLSNESDAEAYKRERKRQKNYRMWDVGTYYGVSSSVLMYKLACRLYKRDLQYLWLAILGLTFQHIHYQIDDKQYAEELKYLKGELECEEEFLMADLPLSDNRLVFSEEYVNDILLIFKEEIYYSTTL